MLKVGTDFSGIGAPEQALKELEINHEVLFACDKDKYARETYLANHIAKVMYDDILNRDNSKVPYVDLYCFGFPCQAFSISGKRKGFDDVRGTLFFNSADYISRQRPKMFIAENVKGLLSHDKPAKSKSKYGRTFNTIINLLAKTVNGQILMPIYEDNLGYNIYFSVLNAKYFDLPQSRERIFIIGFREDVNFKFPAQNNVSKKLFEVLEKNVSDNHYLSEKLLSSLPPIKKSPVCAALRGRGEGWKQNLEIRNDELSNTITSVAKDNLIITGNEVLVSREIRNEEAKKIRRKTGSNAFRGKELLFEKSDVVKTIQTGLTNDNLLIIPSINNRIRKLTPLETMRLQGYPDSFVKPCSDSQIYKQAGNSIPVNVLKAIFKNMPLNL